MTRSKHSARKREREVRIRQLRQQDGDLLKELIRMALQQRLETEEAAGPASGGGVRSGYLSLVQVRIGPF